MRRRRSRSLAGVVRGFSGFGSALIYIPLISAIYDPRTAAGTFVLIDFATGLSVRADGCMAQDAAGAKCCRSRPPRSSRRNSAR